jgi:hypothetical protein
LDSQKDQERVVWDPLGQAESLPLVESFFPLGFPLVLRTNSSDVVAAAHCVWGEFVAAFETEAIQWRVLVRGGAQDPPPSTEPVYRAQGHLLACVLGTENFAVVDLDRCFCFACLTPAVAGDRLFTSYYFLDLALSCLAQRYVTPIHAACVARNGGGILLAGDSGAGKSSLAWACARAGLTYLSDDATWLLRHSEEPVLIGRPQRMRFRPEALQLLPDLAAVPRLETVKGPRSFEIRTAEVPGLATASRCRPSKVVFLDRQADGPAEFHPVGPEETRWRLSATQNLYEPSVWEEQKASLEQLVRCGALRLRYSMLADAVDQIRKVV